jgi:hypothetical protein
MDFESLDAPPRRPRISVTPRPGSKTTGPSRGITECFRFAKIRARPLVDVSIQLFGARLGNADVPVKA